MRGTTGDARNILIRSDISIHVPREGHDSGLNTKFGITSISIHVPREGHDQGPTGPTGAAGAISIHVPREGHDPYDLAAIAAWHLFLSTCPVRGTTVEQMVDILNIPFLSTCPVRGTTDEEVVLP